MTSDPYVRHHGSLRVACLNAEAREQTIGYWYTVTSGATALTAFRTRDELLEWADVCGLTFAEEIPAENGERTTAVVVNGEYRRASHRTATSTRSSRSPTSSLSHRSWTTANTPWAKSPKTPTASGLFIT